MDCDTKASLLKLRALREKLCNNTDQWKKALEVRDFVISELRVLESLLKKDEFSKEECANKLQEILKYYEENNNV